MKHEFHSLVRYSECGQNGELTLGSLVNYFQDVSSFQGEALGIGIQYLKEHHMAWILSAWQIIIDRFPCLAEPVTAQTWAYDFKGFFGMRNFTLQDGSGKMTAWANSIWVLYDTALQRPVRVPKEIIELYGLSPRLEMDYAPRKLSEPKEGIFMDSFAVERHHLDTNRHVNNEQYISMASEYLPEGYRIREMRCEYKKQALLGDMICPFVHAGEDKTAAALRNPEGESFAVVEFFS